MKEMTERINDRAQRMKCNSFFHLLRFNWINVQLIADRQTPDIIIIIIIIIMI